MLNMLRSSQFLVARFSQDGGAIQDEINEIRGGPSHDPNGR